MKYVPAINDNIIENRKISKYRVFNKLTNLLIELFRENQDRSNL